MSACAYQRRRGREGESKSQWAVIMLQFLLHTVGIWGTHVHMSSIFFKPLGLELKLRLAMWDPHPLTTGLRGWPWTTCFQKDQMMLMPRGADCPCQFAREKIDLFLCPNCRGLSICSSNSNQQCRHLNWFNLDNND